MDDCDTVAFCIFGLYLNLSVKVGCIFVPVRRLPSNFQVCDHLMVAAALLETLNWEGTGVVHIHHHFFNFGYTNNNFWWSCCAEAFKPILTRSSPRPADLSSSFSCLPGTCAVNLDAKHRKLWLHNCTRTGRLYGWWLAIGIRACLVGIRNALRWSSSILHRDASDSVCKIFE